MQRLARVKKELQMNEKSPTPGATFWLEEENDLKTLRGQITGPSGPYEFGVFKFDINLPERYPFDPPQVIFTTKVYHPNIDTSGRICLDLLKPGPTGTWKPQLNITVVLKAIRQLLSEPNPHDPLMSEIAAEYIQFPDLFKKKAKEWTKKHAQM